MKLVEKTVLNNDDLISLKVDEVGFCDESEMQIINIHDVEKQEVYGFGGAFTESSAYNYSLMSESQKKETLEYLFGESGLRYNFCRLCLGSSDFTLSEYSYVDENDFTLSSFSIERDKKYVIPFLKDAIAYSKNEIKLFASPWSPPAFMKDNGKLVGGGKLKREYYALYADYMSEFVKRYEEEGIKIFALTLQNEPHAIQTWESCVFDAEDEARFLPYLYDSLKKKNLDVKLIFWDHNKERLFDRAQVVYGECGDKAWGVGYHWYSGKHFDEIEAVRSAYPDKAIIETEFCTGLNGGKTGSYLFDISGNLSAGTNAIVEWNMILDEVGGPYHNRTSGCASPLLYDKNKKEIVLHTNYRQMYVFSHYIDCGAKVLWSSSYMDEIKTLAVKNPDNSIVCVILNKNEEAKPVIVKFGKSQWKVEIAANSATVIKLSD